MQVLYSENYKTLPRKIKDLNKWRDIPVSKFGKLSIIDSNSSQADLCICNNLSKSSINFCGRNIPAGPTLVWKCRGSKVPDDSEKQQSCRTYTT